MKLLKDYIVGISTHTPHAGLDTINPRFHGRLYNFYSHAPCGARLPAAVVTLCDPHFYSHAPCGARPSIHPLYQMDLYISTHTPHAGRDVVVAPALVWIHISTHTPHAGRDSAMIRFPFLFCDFYSHAPCGARRGCSRWAGSHGDFYSHAPCGARRTKSTHHFYKYQFLLTRPMRGATFEMVSPGTVITFLLTRPMRGATRSFHWPYRLYLISTHTPHAGRDIFSVDSFQGKLDFYSHAPCGARRKTGQKHYQKQQFYSHAPCGARPGVLHH